MGQAVDALAVLGVEHDVRCGGGQQRVDVVFGDLDPVFGQRGGGDRPDPIRAGQAAPPGQREGLQ